MNLAIFYGLIFNVTYFLLTDVEKQQQQVTSEHYYSHLIQKHIFRNKTDKLKINLNSVSVSFFNITKHLIVFFYFSKISNFVLLLRVFSSINNDSFRTEMG